MPEPLPKIRDDLIIQEVIRKDGSVQYVIKDPITSAYFQVREPEYFIIRSFDGRTTPGQIAKDFKTEFQLEIDEPSINGFVDHLQELCFLDNNLTRQELLRKQREETDRQRSFLSRLLFFKVKAFDPTPLFNFLKRLTGFFFTRTFVWLASLTIFISFLITMYNAGDIGRGIASLINLKGIILIYISMLFVVMLHEFAHGMTCRHFGGNVKEIGFLFIYFQPAFYCNVSDAWMFPEKRKRLWVSFSGAFFQIFVWALAVIVWRFTASDSFVNFAALAVMAFSGIATLFNFNPLLRYDGYYLLSDYIEIPNLRLKAARFWKGIFKKAFLNETDEQFRPSSRDRKIYFYYGIFSFVYIAFILGYLFILLAEFLVSRWGGTGFLIFAALMVFLFRNIIVAVSKGMVAFFKRRRAFIVLVTVIIIAVLVSFLVKMELRVKGELVLGPMQSILLKYSSNGYAELVRFSADNRDIMSQREVSSFSGDYTTSSIIPLLKIGDAVVNGQVIARLTNTETQKLIDEYTAQLRKAEEELQLLRLGARDEEVQRSRNKVNELTARMNAATQDLQRLNEMLEKGLISKQDWEEARTDSLIWDSRLKAAENELDILLAGARPEELNAKEAEIERLNGQIAFHTGQMEQFEIKSTINGVVLNIDTGEVALEIADLDTMNAIITLSERDLADIGIGQQVKFRARSFPDRSFYGTVYRIDRKIMVDQNGDNVFNIACRVSNEDRILAPGMTGVANVYCGQRKIEELIYRKFFRIIRTEFWDWFDW
jgi:hypothetical protein